MVKTSVNDFYKLHENLSVFLAQHSTDVMGKASVVIHYNFRILHDGLVEYITERDKIITKYGKEDEQGVIGIPVDDTENTQKAMDEINKLGEIEIELPIITMPMSDLYAVADVVPSSAIGSLIWMTNEYQESLKLTDEKKSTDEPDENTGKFTA